MAINSLIQTLPGGDMWFINYKNLDSDFTPDLLWEYCWSRFEPDVEAQIDHIEAMTKNAVRESWPQ